MAMAVVVHLVGEDAILADIYELPQLQAGYVVLRNIRKKDGKPLPYVTEGATAFLYPWTRISFIETMGEVAASATAGANGKPQATTILGFFREDDKRS
jgi:hypothetical protein